MEWYRQVVLQKQIENGTMNMIGWIEEKFAKVGKKLKFMDDNSDVWEYGWVVTMVGGRQSKQERVERRKDHERQRDGSDI